MLGHKNLQTAQIYAHVTNKDITRWLICCRMFVTHPYIKPDTIKLRRYQEAIVARAIDANTLVVLPTGLGKTLIAAMVSAHRLYNFPESKILFLAPTRPLAVQHHKTFERILNVSDTVVLTGMDAIPKRLELWKNNRIIFATPQTIENDIMRGLDLGCVSLIVFDECHRSVGNYSYVYISQEYVRRAKNPLILGLTASPSSDDETVKEICRCLFIKQVEAKTEHDIDVKSYIQDVKTEWIKVELPEEFRKVKSVIEDVLRDYVRELKSYNYLKTANLDKINKKLLLQIQGDIRNEITRGMDSFIPASVVAGAIKVNHALELLETQGISTLDSYLERLQKQKSMAVRKLFSDERMKNLARIVHELNVLKIDHPKLDELVMLIKKHKDEKILIFAQYRDSVCKIMEKLNDNGILVHEFIGQAQKDDKKGMTQKEQIKVLEDFRDGIYNVLVATSVAEEGLDIPKVDLVVFYEPIPSEIRSIQRRGRTGRGSAGKVVVLMAKNTRDESYYWASIHKERKMGDIVRKMRGKFEEEGQQNLAGYVAKNLDSEGIDIMREQSSQFDSSDVEISKPLMSNRDETMSRMISSGPISPNSKEIQIKIFVDVRERNPEIRRILSEKARIEMKQLDVGDFILSDRVGVERKIIPDFVQSIIDKRLLDQASNLSRCFELPVMIIEGDENMYSLRGIHPNAIRGALVSLAIDFGISVIPSRDGEDTANFLYMIAKREQIDEKREIALRGERKPFSMEERQRYVIESFPNVSAVLAKRLLEHFGSVRGVVNATEKELKEIEGIGEIKAGEIVKIARSSYGN